MTVATLVVYGYSYSLKHATSKRGPTMPHPSEPEDPREAAARALCDFEGVPEDTLFEGKPMWMSYLEQVDVVLEAIRFKKGAMDGQATQQSTRSR